MLVSTPHPVRRRALRAVGAATGGAVAIGDLAAAAGISGTHLAQRFRHLVGVTPKRLARTQRFAAAVLALDFAEPVDWGAAACGAGYFDQAHFGHEFRAFTGLTPTRYADGGSCANIPATCWTAGRCRPIDFFQERQLAAR